MRQGSTGSEIPRAPTGVLRRTYAPSIARHPQATRAAVRPQHAVAAGGRRNPRWRVRYAAASDTDTWCPLGLAGGKSRNKMDWSSLVSIMACFSENSTCARYPPVSDAERPRTGHEDPRPVKGALFGDPAAGQVLPARVRMTKEARRKALPLGVGISRYVSLLPVLARSWCEHADGAACESKRGLVLPVPCRVVPEVSAQGACGGRGCSPEEEILREAAGERQPT